MLVKASSPVDLDSVTTVHSDGVVVAGSWVAPAPQTPSTGTLPGWPPAKIFTQSSNVQWSQRVSAAGAALDPAQGWYNVFLRIQVDPTPGDSTMSGVQLTYHDAERQPHRHLGRPRDVLDVLLTAPSGRHRGGPGAAVV